MNERQKGRRRIRNQTKSLLCKNHSNGIILKKEKIVLRKQNTFFLCSYSLSITASFVCALLPSGWWFLFFFCVRVCVHQPMYNKITLVLGSLINSRKTLERKVEKQKKMLLALLYSRQQHLLTCNTVEFLLISRATSCFKYFRALIFS